MDESLLNPELSAFASYHKVPLKRKPDDDKPKAKVDENGNQTLMKKVKIKNVPNDDINKLIEKEKRQLFLAEQSHAPERKGKVIEKPKSTKPNVTIKLVPKTAARVTSQPVKMIEKNGKIEKNEKDKNEASSSKYPDLISTVEVYDSKTKGQQMFTWLVSPVEIHVFFEKFWEKRPMLVKRSASAKYYSSILSSSDIDVILRNNVLMYGKNIDITSYADGTRETHNPVGRALPAAVWDFYSNGCSVRLTNPQTFHPKLHYILETLQEYFGCVVGANSYLTPPNTQGFAPHYDDIEAFIVQLEGTKHWKLYHPRTENEALPRTSSENFTEADLNKPFAEYTLNAGDLLYFPRGTIHQGQTSDAHSLHVTISVYQRTSWADLLEKLLPAALKNAVESDREFREGLPLHFLDHVGLVHLEKESKNRAEFMAKLQVLVTKLFQFLPVDAAVDQIGKQFQHDALPPILSGREKMCTAHGDGERLTNDGKVVNKVVFDLQTKVKLLRRHILRLVTEEDTVRIYHHGDNAKEYHAEEPQFLEIEPAHALAVECLINRYPQYTAIGAIEVPDLEDAAKIQLISDLWERGLILTSKSLRKDDGSA